MTLFRSFLAALPLLACGVATSFAQQPILPAIEPPGAGSAGAAAPEPSAGTPPNFGGFDGAPLGAAASAADEGAVPGEGGDFGAGRGGFGGFGGGGGFFGARGPGMGGLNVGLNASQSRFVASGAIMVTWSEKYDAAWGFSKATGKWTRQELDPPAKEPPVVGDGLGVIRAGSLLYAYSGKTGRWGMLRSPKDHRPQFSIQDEYVLVNDGSDIYTFADATGRWTSPDGANVKDDAAMLVPAAPYDPLGNYASETASSLRRRYEEMDQYTAKLAEQYRSQSSTIGPEHPELQRLKEQLTTAVKRAFLARQQLHQAELAEFQRRIQDVQRTIEARNRIQDEIIMRRVNELLDPSLKWDRVNETVVAPGITTSGASGSPIVGSPIGIAGPAQSIGEVPDITTTESVPAGRRPTRELGELPSAEFRVDVGVVSEANEPERIVISSAELGGIRRGEELIVIRNDQFNGNKLAGWIEIVQADEETAIGRVLVTRRVVVANRYQPDQVSPGDRVARVRQPEVIEPLEPPLDTSRETSANNLKQLMLAMHNYHDTYQRFPPAVILGKDGQGGPPHSWRVELLPYLNQQGLYDQYRFHEPWDSEHNRTLLGKMPAVFRSPLDKPDSPHASYFALVTPGFTPDEGGALFGHHSAGGVAPPGLSGIPARAAGPLGEGSFAPDDTAGDAVGGFAVEPSWHRGTMFSRPEGIRLHEIIDGTSNTVALVEAKRGIPWTQPHDIAYVADQSLPVLGGWFPKGWHAGFADGSVKFLSDDNDAATIRALFTIGGGEVVQPKLVEP